jgi:SAM-dependent methyltransferase
MYTYDTNYFGYINAGSTRSAELTLPAILRHFRVTSVADFGCGQGAWLAVWRKLGIVDITGVDGPYMGAPLVPESHITRADLTAPIDLGRRFDLVQSLEVAEHLPERAANQFVRTLANHGDLIFFSAAPPGQGGEYHVNEQPYEFWRAIFRDQGFALLDILRPQLQAMKEIEPWYRFNAFIYVRKGLLPSLAKEIRTFEVPDGTPIRDVSPSAYRLRKRLVGLLPVSVVTQAAILKRHVAAYTRRLPASATPDR